MNSYAAIDYINAIPGDEYVQDGCTVNAEWYGVPQERHPSIAMGVRKDIFKKEKRLMPEAPDKITLLTVGENILKYICPQSCKVHSDARECYLLAYRNGLRAL